jgi:hypothetical protein
MMDLRRGSTWKAICDDQKVRIVKIYYTRGAGRASRTAHCFNMLQMTKEAFKWQFALLCLIPSVLCNILSEQMVVSSGRQLHDADIQPHAFVVDYWARLQCRCRNWMKVTSIGPWFRF